VRKYSEYIRRFATESSHTDITKENYYDLYNMAVCLLKSVDSLDPDKVHSTQHRKSIEFDVTSQISGDTQIVNSNTGIVTPNAAMQPSEFELLQGRKSFDFYYNRSSTDGPYLTREVPLYYNQPSPSAPFINSALPPYQAVPKPDNGKTKNFSGEVFF